MRKGGRGECHGLAGVGAITHKGDDVGIESQGVERIGRVH